MSIRKVDLSAGMNLIRLTQVRVQRPVQHSPVGLEIKEVGGKGGFITDLFCFFFLMGFLF